MKLALSSDATVDLVLSHAGLEIERDFGTAVLISLLSDRRAGLSDPLPILQDAARGPVGPDRRGWAGDALSEIPGDRIGSHLWLLSREKQTESTRRRALDYARAALQWMIDDGHAHRIEVDAQWDATGRLVVGVEIHLVTARILSVSVNPAGDAYAL